MKNQNSAITDRRAGITLTEVLSSILIMGLGVTFVISLFPVALARSLNASQLTNAGLMRLNAEATIDLLPSIIHDPDGNGNLIEHFNAPQQRNYLVDPWGYIVHWQDLGTGILPLPTPTQPVQRGVNLRDFMGNDGQTDPGALAILPRYSGGIPIDSLPAAEAIAAGMVASRDGWVDHVDVEVTGGDLLPTGDVPKTQISLLDVDLSSLPTSGTSGSWALAVDTRIVLYDENGRISAAYPVTGFNTATGQVTWSEDLNANGTGDSGEDLNFNGEFDVRALPVADFHFGAGAQSNATISVSRAVIEVSKARLYSWMLTVRKGTDGQAAVDVVVMFNRGVDPVNEELFQATFVPSTFGTFPNHILVKNQRNNDREPFLKKGGFVLDAVNARWYRVTGFETRPALIGTWPHGEYNHVLRVDQPIVEAAGVDTDLNGVLDAGETDVNGDGELPETAIFLPGVVEVYPLGTKALPESL